MQFRLLIIAARLERGNLFYNNSIESLNWFFFMAQCLFAGADTWLRGCKLIISREASREYHRDWDVISFAITRMHVKGRQTAR